MKNRLDMSNEDMKEAFAPFEGVEHRLENVRTVDLIKYVNDSKSCQINSTWYALESTPGPIILLLGGCREAEWKTLRGLVMAKVDCIISLGDHEQIFEDLDRFADYVVRAPSMRKAVAYAHNIATEYRGRHFDNHTVLLSPGSTSYYEFEDYMERGRVFKELVNSL